MSGIWEPGSSVSWPRPTPSLPRRWSSPAVASTGLIPRAATFPASATGRRLFRNSTWRPARSRCSSPDSGSSRRLTGSSCTSPRSTTKALSRCLPPVPASPGISPSPPGGTCPAASARRSRTARRGEAGGRAAPGGGAGPPPTLGIWSAGTGQVKVLGRGVGADSGAVISAYPAPGAGHSLLAWMPATCRYPVNCAIRITSTSTLASRTLRSPLPHGFALGGAVSPDGSQLAVFVNRSPGTGGGRVQLVIVSTRTGAARLVPGASFLIGEDVAWARWLPGGKQLIAGGVDRDDIVTPATLATRPLRFRHSAGGDIGYSAVVIPPRQKTSAAPVDVRRPSNRKTQPVTARPSQYSPSRGWLTPHLEETCAKRSQQSSPRCWPPP